MNAPAKEKAALGTRPEAASKTNSKQNRSGHAGGAQPGGADALLGRLDAVRQTGPGRWIARCPAHDDHHPSLSIRELIDGFVLVKCHAGCDTECILTAVGLTFGALYPDRVIAHHVFPERQPFPAMDVLRCVASEALVCAVAAGNLAQGLELSEDDRARLLLAARRLQTAAEACRA